MKTHPKCINGECANTTNSPGTLCITCGDKAIGEALKRNAKRRSSNHVTHRSGI